MRTIADNIFIHTCSTFAQLLQIFKEVRAIQGGLEALEDSSGAIMSLGVQCIANEKRLEKARTKLKEEKFLNFVEKLLTLKGKSLIKKYIVL